MIPRTVAWVAVGAGIGVVAALMGVAGGELLIPTIVLLYGLDIKLAGSLSLAVSLPTMLVAFARYSRDNSFRTLKDNSTFVIAMALGSIAGTLLGGILLGRRAVNCSGPCARAAAAVSLQGVRHQ